MMFVIPTFCISIFAGASLTSAASAKFLPDDDLTGLIRAIGQRDSTLKGATQRKKERSDSVAPIRVLDFITQVCEEASFYDSGYWGPEEFSSIPYRGPLPTVDSNSFCKPIDGVITSPFGYRQLSKKSHNGIDISLHMGDTVRAALPGIVSQVGFQRGGYGIFVIISHSGGLETRYAHLKCSHVTPGQPVKGGENIGQGGMTGNSTGPHLHFETRFNGTPIDPTIVFPMGK